MTRDDDSREIRRVVILLIVIVVIAVAVTTGFQVYTQRALTTSEANARVLARHAERAAEVRLYDGLIADCSRVMESRRASNVTARTVRKFLLIAAHSRLKAATEFDRIGQAREAATNRAAAKAETELADSFAIIKPRRCRAIIPRP